ncbi:MAG TPA: gliding motility-associated ABC transporter substrate-binding protein GldG [Tenuifilaceae bacterium]|nr:gliding motility-associated ABC transporter substrate-binding protein GldG [Tenuifilaceae bacterium]HPJ46846.1 gliding motility-associated ABC transporter substrate-binding protein GldG [Tenuifilaceae bacterium]HRX68369.1 gliding motility-associated ABC transporter substrate-binding protein GldG [Tenuifilaceae bacterium]
MTLSNKKKNIIQLVVSIATIILAGYISTFFFFRIDMTSEKRYTLNPVTKETLKNLNDIVHIRVYLDGDLPIGFMRMRRELKETLDEFKAYGGNMFHYEFINPSASVNSKDREALYRDLYEKGIEPTNVQESNPKGGSSQRIVFPGAIVSFMGKESPLNLLKNNPNLSGDENINISIQNFEFALMQVIIKLSQTNQPKIAFVHGHDELDEFETGDIVQELASQYEVHRVILGGEVGGLDPYSLVVVAGPKKHIPEADKLVLDQYLMNGGKILWFVDAVNVSIDSLSQGATTLAYPNNTNLEDMLFRYGVRVNPVLIQDMQCAVIPVNVALAGQDPRFSPVPWVYFPLLNAPETHPITRNLNLIRSRFVSPIDTVGGNSNLAKRILLSTSPYSRTLNVPLFINLRQIEQSPLERDFNRSFIPVAALVEGTFNSVFTNRPLAAFNNGKPFNFKEKSIPTRMLVVANSDIIRNDVSRRTDGAYITPLGYDKYTNQTFGNKEFVVNSVHFLVDETGLMELKNRDFKLRLLDKKKILEERKKWQLINLLIPSLTLIVLGIVWFFIRRYKFTR